MASGLTPSSRGPRRTSRRGLRYKRATGTFASCCGDMASGLTFSSRNGKGSRALRRIFGLCLWVVLSAWLLVRLWVPLGTQSSFWCLGLTALFFSGGLCILSARFRLIERFCLPWGFTWKTALVALTAFFLGTFFDISYAMFTAEGALIIHPLIRLLCHAGNGVVFSVIVLALLWSVRQLTGLTGSGRWQLILLLAAVNLLTLLYVLTSKTVYFWDNAGYWSVAMSLAKEPLRFEQLRSVLVTTITLDYNHLLAWPISLLMRLFGPSRAVFLFATANLYTFPGLWGLWVLGRKKRFSPLFLAGLFPMLIYTGAVGFVDVAACSLGIWAYAVYTSGSPAIPRGLVTGFLLVGTFTLRRYFFFFALSFGVAAFVVKLLFSRKNWQDFVALFLSCAVCTVSFMYSFLLEKVLGTNYGDLYSAYALGVHTDFLLVFRYFGLIFLAALALACLFLLFTKPESRFPVCFGLVQVIVCFLAFVLVQTHGQQHLLLYVPGLAFLSALVFELLPTTIPCLVLAAVTTVNCCIPKEQPGSIQEIPGFAPLPSFHFYGNRRSDAEELVALADFVDSLSIESPHSAAVLSSSFTFNVEILRNLRPSFNLSQPQQLTQIISSGEVDKRDGFNWEVARADYLIVGDPVQTHLGEDNQRVVTTLAHWVLDGTGPGTAYQSLPQSFQLQNGVTIRIYQRIRDWTPEEFRMLSQTLQDCYPDYAWLYVLPAWAAK